MVSDARQDGRDEGKHRATCGLREDRVDITDSDTSLCECSTGSGKALCQRICFTKCNFVVEGDTCDFLDLHCAPSSENEDLLILTMGPHYIFHEP